MLFLNQSLYYYFKLLCVVTLLLLLNRTQLQGQYLEQQSHHQAPIIVIDPGHGGKDKGCHAHHYNEKDIALALSKKIGAQIKVRMPDAQIVFTRTTDIFIKLSQRVEIANSYDPDVFISVHANSIDVTEVRGSEIFILGPHSDAHYRQIEERENASSLMEYDMATDSGIESFILQSATKSDNMSKSIELAKSIEAVLSSLKSHKCRGIKQANFAVLKNIASPGILLESGYLTNDHDYKTLNSDHGQNIMADRIANGICQYLVDYPRVKHKMTSPVIHTEAITVSTPIAPPAVARSNSGSSNPNIKTVDPDETKTEGKSPDYHLVIATSPNQKFAVNVPEELHKTHSIQLGDDNQYYYTIGPYADLVSAMADRTICINNGYKGTYVTIMDQILKVAVD
jgi:N-acetylmuramoyl-L-alanine amidase